VEAHLKLYLRTYRIGGETIEEGEIPSREGLFETCLIPIWRVLSSASNHSRLSFELPPMYRTRALPRPQNVGKFSLDQTFGKWPVGVAIPRPVTIIPFHPDMVNRNLHRW
jgi:hypothetical protein